MGTRNAPTLRRRPVLVGVILVVGGVASLLALEAARPGQDLRATALDLVAGWVLVVAGNVASRRRPDSRTGDLLLLAGLAWFAGDLAPATGLVGSVATLLARLPLAVLVHALLADPSGRLGSPERRTITGAAYAAALLAPVWVGAGRVVLGLLLAVAVLGVRWWADPGTRRARRRPDMALLAMAAWLVGATLVTRALPGGGRLDPSLVLDGLVIAIAAVLAAPLRSTSERRSRAAEAALDLGDARTDPLSDAIARAIGDPDARVFLRDPGSLAARMTTGDPLDQGSSAAGAAAVTDLAQPDGTLVCIVHRPGALDDPGLRAGVDRALGLLLANRRLRAELADQLDAVERSRSRLVSADLAERSRLEAELDGGLGRRLDARTREIDAVLGSLTTGAMPGPSRRAPVVGSLALVRTEIRETRAELQALTRGRQPAAVPGGLAAALAMMAARCSIPVVVDAAAGPWHPTVEATVRFVVAEALTNVARHARATHASVALREVGHVVRVTIADDGIGGADPALGTGLHGIGARVGEAGGGWSLGAADGGGTRLTVELPAHPVGPPAAEAAA